MNCAQRAVAIAAGAGYSSWMNSCKILRRDGLRRALTDPRQPQRRGGLVQAFMNDIEDTIAEIRWGKEATANSQRRGLSSVGQ